jgi:hypothetical protein
VSCPGIAGAGNSASPKPIWDTIFALELEKDSKGHVTSYFDWMAGDPWLKNANSALINLMQILIDKRSQIADARTLPLEQVKALRDAIKETEAAYKQAHMPTELTQPLAPAFAFAIVDSFFYATPEALKRLLAFFADFREQTQALILPNPDDHNKLTQYPPLFLLTQIAYQAPYPNPIVYRLNVLEYAIVHADMKFREVLFSSRLLDMSNPHLNKLLETIIRAIRNKFTPQELLDIAELADKHGATLLKKEGKPTSLAGLLRGDFSGATAVVGAGAGTGAGAGAVAVAEVEIGWSTSSAGDERKTPKSPTAHRAASASAP